MTLVELSSVCDTVLKVVIMFNRNNTLNEFGFSIFVNVRFNSRCCILLEAVLSIWPICIYDSGLLTPVQHINLKLRMIGKSIWWCATVNHGLLHLWHNSLHFRFRFDEHFITNCLHICMKYSIRSELFTPWGLTYAHLATMYIVC